MITDVISLHIARRLKMIHLSGIGTMIVFFLLLHSLGNTTDIHTLPAEMILLLMALLLAMSYGALVGLKPSSMESKAPLFVFFALNICVSALIWATGVLQSPFIILYVILIIITSQLYRYAFGLLQTVLALAGFVFVYAATIGESIPYYPLLSYTHVSVLFQPTRIILLYGMLYGILFFFTVLSSSSARILLFRPMSKIALDTTFQEKIIQEMPLGIIIIDKDMRILGNNAAATAQFPAKIPSRLSDTLEIPANKIAGVLSRIARTHEEKKSSWKLDTGESIPVTISARAMHGAKKDDTTYILFVQ